MKEIRLIRWHDSYGVSSGWEDLAEFHPNELMIESVGFVLYEDDKIISLAGNYAEKTDRTPEQANGIITIPKCCVKESAPLTFSSFGDSVLE